tara:strand:+ start:503 stop:670 length:168 start_codon:yes stop_codon:yes gene_type:complete
LLQFAKSLFALETQFALMASTPIPPTAQAAGVPNQHPPAKIPQFISASSAQSFLS